MERKDFLKKLVLVGITVPLLPRLLVEDDGFFYPRVGDFYVYYLVNGCTMTLRHNPLFDSEKRFKPLAHRINPDGTRTFIMNSPFK